MFFFKNSDCSSGYDLDMSRESVSPQTLQVIRFDFFPRCQFREGVNVIILHSQNSREPCTIESNKSKTRKYNPNSAIVLFSPFMVYGFH